MKPNKPCCDLSRLRVQRVKNRDLIKDMMRTKHYLKRWPTGAQDVFAIIKDETDIVGGLVFGRPVRKYPASSISPLIEDDDVSELLRVWIEDGHGQNIESMSISRAFKMLPPKKKVVISYADPAEGHIGTIYKAIGGLFQDLSVDRCQNLNPEKNPNNFSYNLTDRNDRNGWLHYRSLQRHFGSHNLEEMKLKLCYLKGFWRKPLSDKYRYLWWRGLSRQREAFIKSLYHPVLPYLKAEECKTVAPAEWITIE